MDGPYPPGYSPCVTGIDIAGERHLVGRVYRYGPRRWWVQGWLCLFVQAQDVELVYQTEPVPLPKTWTNEEWTAIADSVAALAEIRAERLNAIDPQGRGVAA